MFLPQCRVIKFIVLTFSSPQKEALSPSALTPFTCSPSPSPKKPPIYLYLCKVLYFGLSHHMESHNMWSVVTGFFHGAYFQDSPVYQYLISYYGRIIFLYMHISHFVHVFISWWRFELFPPFLSLADLFILTNFPCVFESYSLLFWLSGNFWLDSKY